MRHAHDMHQMDAEQRASGVQRFLDGLDVESALALRDILNADQTSVTNQFFDGQVVGLLRYVHRVDPGTGDPLLDVLGSAPDTAR
jgi:hypothetical protein